MNTLGSATEASVLLPQGSRRVAVSNIPIFLQLQKPGILFLPPLPSYTLRSLLLYCFLVPQEWPITYTPGCQNRDLC